jgi:hypothetical protein
MQPAVDISKYQGAWQDYPADIVMIKISGGDDGLYIDSQAANNYTDAKAAGKHVGGYHFVGWSTNASAEAAYFCRAMLPLTENDVYALDAENGAVDVSASSPAYLLEMVNYIHAQVGVYPIVYMNLSTLNSYDWSAVLANCGLWLADWNGNPSGTINTSHTYVMQQYADGPVYDHDEWYGTLAEFDLYGWHAAVQPPAPVAVVPPAPVVTPPVDPVPVVTPPVAPTPPPVVNPPVVVPPVVNPIPKPTPKPVVVVTPPKNLLAVFLDWLKGLFK